MSYAITYLALGAGVDSTAVYLMSNLGLHGCPRADLAIFADTWDEPGFVMEHLWWLASWAEANGGIPIHVATRGGLLASNERNIRRGSPNGAQPPLFVLTVEEEATLFGVESKRTDGQMRRSCTRDFKIRVCQAYLRHFLGIRAFRAGGPRVLGLVGVAADEMERVAPSREPWCDLAYPSVDAGLKRRDEEALIRAHGWPVPKKSACVYCPYHGDDYWRMLRRDYPHEFARACAADEALRRLPKMRGETFVHRSRLPLAQADFGDARDAFGSACAPGAGCGS